MVMPSLKTGHDAARRRFWLAMSGFVMALVLLPFSYKGRTSPGDSCLTSRAENPGKELILELAQRFPVSVRPPPGS